MDTSPPTLCRLPIVVGVTGHRDLVLAPKDPALPPPRAKLEKELRALLDDFPHSPIVVLSGLAEGADSLAAEVTLALSEEPRYRGPDGRPRISLFAAVPLPLELAAVDFLNPAHAATVEGLRKRAMRTIEIPPSVRPHAAGPNPASPREEFDRGYARLGAYLARNCHLLLALWNGKPSRSGGSGGTANVVAWFKGGAPVDDGSFESPPNPLRVPDGLRCIRIPCERASDPECAPLDFVQSDHEKKTADAVLRQIDEFNADAASIERTGPIPESDLSESLVEPGGPGRACAVAYVDLQRVADCLAGSYKGSRRSVVKLLFALAAVALLGFEFFSHGPHGVARHFALLLAYVAAFGASMGLLALARKSRLESKFLVYRSFAEALRVQCVWRGVGLGDRADDGYGVLHRDAIAWVRQGIKGLHVVAEGAPSPLISDLVAARWARTSWIAGQIKYFRDNFQSTRAGLRVGHAWAKGWIVTGLVLASAYALGIALGLASAGGEAGLPHDVHGGLIIAMVLFVAAGGFCRAWASRMAYEATIDRYRAAGEVFGRGDDALDAALKAKDLVAVRSVIRALGREALAENVAWVLLHRDHPLEIVAGG